MTRTFLVVAHRTLIGEHLLDHVRELAKGDSPARFHLVVPMHHPNDHAYSDGEMEATASERLNEGLAAFTEAGLEASGEIGDENPVYAASTAMRNLAFDCDGIIVSTLPQGISHWLRVDVPSRMRREFDLPITHLTAKRDKAERTEAA